MTGFMIAGMMIVLTVLVMMARTNLRRWLGYANIVDVMFTIVIIALFHSTFSGVVAASFAGVFMSLMLWILRSSIGCERLSLKRVSWKRGYYAMYWKSISAAECRGNYWMLNWFNGMKEKHGTSNT